MFVPLLFFIYLLMRPQSAATEGQIRLRREYEALLNAEKVKMDQIHRGWMVSKKKT